MFTSPTLPRHVRGRRLVRRRTTRRIAVPCIAVLCVAATALLGSSPPVDAELRGVPKSLRVGVAAKRAEDFGRFRLECGFSHRAQVDPIVSPGIIGTFSHHVHDFFGNRSTASYSTYASMLEANTTCDFSPDTAGYWVPSLRGTDGEYVEPVRMLIYYRNRPISYGTSTPFPADFRMVAGGDDSYPHAYWTCDGQSDAALDVRAESAPDCGGADLKLHVFFPSCWDGRNLDSPDHRSHVAYAYDEDDGTSTDIGDDTCPETHPVKVPQVHLRVQYPVSDGRQYALADGSALAHADFWNTWDQAVLERLVDDCLRGGTNCGALAD